MEIFPAPEGGAASPDYAVFVNGEPVFVYPTAIAAIATWAFDSAETGAVTVEIRPRSPYEIGAGELPTVRPLSRNIVAEAFGETVRIVLAVPQNLAVEFAGLPPLYLFASLPDRERPNPADPTVHFFAAGKVHDAGDFLHLSDGQSVYIEGGAVLRNTGIRAANSTNVSVRGQGIMDASALPYHTKRLLVFENCDHVHVENIVSVGSPTWNVVFGACRNVEVENVRLLTWQVTGDGIDIVGSENVRVSDCFIRTNDDCVAVKSVNYVEGERAQTAATAGIVDWRGDVRNVVVERCVLHNDRAGNVLEIGYETQCDTIENIVFLDCDVIAAHGYGGVFTIHNGDRATIRNVLYESIRVEHYFDLLVDIRVLHSRYSRDEKRGRIENIRFHDISCVANGYNAPSVIGGFDEESPVENISFENFRVGETVVRNASDLHLFTGAVRNISLGIKEATPLPANRTDETFHQKG
ncbi:MAG: right-handed parallel beta-helix repeat-containing protein [Armatimonadetes bacterium]|nr:right-handed parallel beta-helix repeat-containing protein [Armatimonadota bacterium]